MSSLKTFNFQKPKRSPNVHFINCFIKYGEGVNILCNTYINNFSSVKKKLEKKSHDMSEILKTTIFQVKVLFPHTLKTPENERFWDVFRMGKKGKLVWNGWNTEAVPIGVPKICTKFTGKHLCGNMISTKLLCSFTEITLWHGCYPVKLLHIFRTPCYKNTFGRLLLELKARSQAVSYFYIYKLNYFYCHCTYHIYVSTGTT